MISLLTRLIGTRLAWPVRAGIFLAGFLLVGLVLHDFFYGLVLGLIGAGGAWRQGRKTSFAAAPVVPEPPLPGAGPPPPAPPVATTEPPAVTTEPPAEGPSLYGPA